jgi:MFS family permease
MNAASANIHAYIADCSVPSRRSRVFSIYLGLVYIGMAIGPAFGGLLIRQSGDILTVFYYAFASHISFASMVWFFIPESLAPTQLFRAKVAYSQSKAQVKSGTLARLASFLAPLKLFIPVTVATGSNPLKRRKDRNLTLLAAAHGFVIMLAVRVFPKPSWWMLDTDPFDHRVHIRSSFNMVFAHSGFRLERSVYEHVTAASTFGWNAEIVSI